MKLKVILLFFFQLAVVVFSTAQIEYDFHHFTVEDGLSHNNVYCIYRDSHGYVWIGTGSSLHRFSGNEMKTYRHAIGDNTTLGPGYVRSIFEDFDGAIWVGLEGGGLSKYHNGIFSNFSASYTPGHLTNNYIEDIVQTPDSTIYIATWGGGINTYKNGQFSAITKESTGSNGLRSNNVVDLYYDEETGVMWIGSWGGGLCSMKNGVITNYSYENGFDHDKARCIEKSADGALWIGSWGNGLYKYQDSVFTKFDFSKEPIRTAEENKILCLSADQSGNVWVGTFGGGIKLYNGKEFQVMLNNPDDRNSISSNFIECTYIDPDGNLWAGTYGSGITKIEKTFFHRYKHTNEVGSLSDNYVRDMLEFEDGNIWICTRAKGIDIFDGEKFTSLDQVYGDEAASLPVFTMTKTQNGDIWMGGVTGMGLKVMSGNKITEVSKKYDINFREYNINTIIESFDHSIYIGGDYESGLIKIKNDVVDRFYYDPDNDNSLSGNSIWCLYQSKDSTIWVGTRRYGLNSYKNGVWKRYRSIPENPETLSSDFIFDIFESSEGYIWIGTEKGLNKLDRTTGKFKRYFEKDGLINDYVTAVEECNNGFLWISTHGGLVKFDPQTEHTWNYDIRDGIDVYPFNTNASHLGKSGNMYFGGVGGFLVFNPDSIQTNEPLPEIQITDLLFSDKSAEIGPDKILTQRIEETDAIELNRNAGKVTLEFSSMTYNFGSKYTYMYKLEGFDPNWITTKNHAASYTNLPPGDYTFYIKSSPDGLKWSPSRRLNIAVLPDFYETIIFKMLLSAFIVLLVIWIFQWRNRYLIRQKVNLSNLVKDKTDELEKINEKITKQNKLLNEHNEEMTAKSVELRLAYEDVDERNQELEQALKELRNTQKHLVHSEKMASLGVLSAGIAHEINNPLNFIQGGLESFKLLLRNTNNLMEFKDESSPLMNIMQEGIDRTSKIVKSLSHFSRDVEVWDEACNIPFIIDNCLTMTMSPIRNSINVIKNIGEIHVPVRGNSGKLHQAFLNILLNSIQSIDEKGEITISIHYEHNAEKIVISDNGCGIPEEHLSKISDPFFTTKAPGKGTGMGLAITYDIIEKHGGTIYCESIVGKGTSVIIELPIALRSEMPLKEKINSEN